MAHLVQHGHLGIAFAGDSLSVPTTAPDWPQIVALYELLEHRSPTPIVRLNQAVAVAMTCGPVAGLRRLDALGTDRMVGHHRLDAVRAHLLELAGDLAAARANYLKAARATTSLPEKRYLEARAARLKDPAPD